MAHVMRVPALTLLLLSLGLASAAPASAQQAKGPAPKEDVPLHITSARLEADQEKRLVIFSGQVKAQQGDAILYSDQLFVYYKPSPETAAKTAPDQEKKPEKGSSPLTEMGGEKIDHIEAKGNVRFVQEDRVATGELGIFYQDRDEILLLGHPQLWRGENHLKGERILFNLKDNRVTVESSPVQRVEAYLYQTQGSPTSAPAFLPGSQPRPERRSGERRP